MRSSRSNGASRSGGLNGMIARSDANAAALDRIVAERDWLGHLAADPASRSRTSVCLTVAGADEAVIKKMASLLEAEDAAYDIAGYRDAPAGSAHLVRRDGRYRRYRRARPMARLGLCAGDCRLIPPPRRRPGSSIAAAPNGRCASLRQPSQLDPGLRRGGVSSPCQKCLFPTKWTPRPPRSSAIAGSRSTRSPARRPTNSPR